MTLAYITGARGFIGKHLSKHCSSKLNMKVVGLGHGSFTPAELENAGLIAALNGDVSSFNLDRLASDYGYPDVIFHLAGGSSVGPSLRVPQEDFRRTVLTTCELLDWVRLNSPKSKLVLASTAAVYGKEHVGPIDELANVKPCSPYGFHKRMAEMVMESYSSNFGLHGHVVRLFSVYGPELRKQLLWDTCLKLSKGANPLQMHGTGEERRDWMHIDDCVRLLGSFVAMPEMHNVPLLNGGTGASVSVSEVVNHLVECWGQSCDVDFNGIVPDGDPRQLIANVDRSKALGFTPTVDWKRGVQEYVTWFRNQK